LEYCTTLFNLPTIFDCGAFDLRCVVTENISSAGGTTESPKETPLAIVLDAPILRILESRSQPNNELVDHQRWINLFML
jgi:hypothetical protein